MKILALLVVFLGGFPATALEFSGRAKIKDGDSVVVAKREIRLFGIDAPELYQKCFEANGEQWACGLEAKQFLQNLVGNNEIKCVEKDTDHYGRSVGICYRGDDSLNAAMVREGWAVAYTDYSRQYQRQENAASAAEKGIWRGDFTEPKLWRRMNY